MAYRALARSFLPSKARRQAGLLFFAPSVSDSGTTSRQICTQCSFHRVTNTKTRGMSTNTRFALSAFFLILAVALPALAYEYPLSTDAIRDAYFLARSPDHVNVNFLSRYSHTLPEFIAGPYTSIVTIETPYVQVAEEVRLKVNYHAQDAVEEFSDKPADFRIQMDINYSRSISDSAKVILIQNDKEIIPLSIKRSSIYPMEDEYNHAGSIGEHLELECSPEKVDSSALTVKIILPDGRKAQTKFDLAELR